MTVRHRVFKVESNLRSFVYVAKVTKKTGKLVSITAGCRYWQTFQQARKYYWAREPKLEYAGAIVDGKPHYDYDGPRWSNYWISRQSPHASAQEELRACRREARRIIDKLENRVGRYQDNKRKRK